MEYAIDKTIKDRDNKVHYSKAIYSGKEYLCPYCSEKVFLKSNCFSHEPIHNRTPLQRACPEYHPGADVNDRISNPVDRLYVYNGGMPLYLCGDEIFELRAYIPPISDAALNKLKQTDVKLHINTNSTLTSEEKVYGIESLSSYKVFYKVDTLQKWIDIKCSPDHFIDEEIRKKWLWGIRGIDENDIYHSNKNGGYRVATNGNIFIGSQYRILNLSKSLPSVNGIIFKKTGTINLKEAIGTAYSVYDVYEMQVKDYTNESQAFVDNKGYQLKKQKGDFIPLWPPAAIVGNQLIYNKKNAMFLHLKSSNEEFVSITEKNKILEAKNKWVGSANIITIPINESMAVWLSQTNEPTSEIKFQINHSQYINEHQSIKKELIFEDKDGKQILLDQSIQSSPPEDGRMYIKSNIPFCASVRNGNYVMFSSKMSFENIFYSRILIVDCKAFGKFAYQYKREEKAQVGFQNIDWHKVYKKLCIHRAPVVKANFRYIELLSSLKMVKDTQSYLIYRLIESWVKTNSVPITAINDLDNLINMLRGLKYE